MVRSLARRWCAHTGPRAVQSVGQIMVPVTLPLRQRQFATSTFSTCSASSSYSRRIILGWSSLARSAASSHRHFAVNRIQLAARLSEARFAHGKGGLHRDSRSLDSMPGFKSGEKSSGIFGNRFFGQGPQNAISVGVSAGGERCSTRWRTRKPGGHGV